MTGVDKRHRLLSELSGIEETWNPERQRHLPVGAAFGWLAAGWRDLMIRPALSLAYGLAVFLVSVVLIWTMFAVGWDYILFPALAGFMIIAPILAVGLYEKSRAIEDGERPTMVKMLEVKPRAGAQIFFTGLLLCLLMILWMRAAVLIYALFFGIRPFPGLSHVVNIIFTTPIGLAMLVVGTLVGGLFAAFGFAISVFSVPMLLDQRTDALTAMATSMAMVWNNLVPMIAWGAIVLVLFAVSVATGLIGLIVSSPFSVMPHGMPTEPCTETATCHSPVDAKLEIDVVYLSASAALCHGRTNMDVPISLAFGPSNPRGAAIAFDKDRRNRALGATLHFRAGGCKSVAAAGRSIDSP